VGCGIIALVTTCYHHTLYKRVDAPPNTQHMQSIKKANVKPDVMLETNVKFKHDLHQNEKVLGEKNNRIPHVTSIESERNQRKGQEYVINLQNAHVNDKEVNQNKWVNQNEYIKQYHNKTLLGGRKGPNQLKPQQKLVAESFGNKPFKDIYNRKDYMHINKTHIKPMEHYNRQVYNLQYNATKHRVKTKINHYINGSHHKNNLHNYAREKLAHAKPSDNLVIKQGQYQANNNKALLNNAPVARVQVDGEYHDIVIRNNNINDIKKTVKDNNDVLMLRNPAEFTEWEKSKAELCEGNFQAYYNEFALLKDVIVDRNFFKGTII
jgi:hypothetical protein